MTKIILKFTLTFILILISLLFTILIIAKIFLYPFTIPILLAEVILCHFIHTYKTQDLPLTLRFLIHIFIFVQSLFIKIGFKDFPFQSNVEFLTP